MTTEIQEYRCPSCGQRLGQQEYQRAREIFQKQLRDELQNRDEKHTIEIQHLKAKFNAEIESIVSSRLNQERIKTRQEILEKDNKHKQEIEEIRLQALNFANERIRQAAIEKDEKYRQIEEQYREKIKRLDEDNKKLLIQLEEQSRELNRVPSDLSGQAGENGLFVELQQTFSPPDELTCKKNGVPMADIVQVIVTRRGERVRSPIIYDKKTGEKVTGSDIAKAKNYMRIHGTDYCIVVTTDLRNEKRYTEEREGILLVRPSAVIDVAMGIRKYLIESHELAKVNRGKESKKDSLYEFFTSAEYNRDLQTRIETQTRLDDLQKKEEESHRKIWSARKKLIQSWDEVDSKFAAQVNYITHEDESSEQEQNEEDGE